MNGINVVGCALTILPLVLQVLESYRKIKDELRLLRHSDKELRRLKMHSRVSYQLWLNEMSLLLSLLGVQEGNDIMLDPSSYHWTDERKENQIQQALGPSSSAFVELLQDMELDLDQFRNIICEAKFAQGIITPPQKRGRKGSTLVPSKKAMGDAQRKIRNRITDFAALRGYFSTQQQTEWPSQPKSGYSFLEPCAKIQEVAATLHEALTESWDCRRTDNFHSRLGVSLCLNAMSFGAEDVKLRLWANSDPGHYSQDPFIWVSINAEVDQSMSNESSSPGRKTGMGVREVDCGLKSLESIAKSDGLWALILDDAEIADIDDIQDFLKSLLVFRTTDLACRSRAPDGMSLGKLLVDWSTAWQALKIARPMDIGTFACQRPLNPPAITKMADEKEPLQNRLTSYSLRQLMEKVKVEEFTVVKQLKIAHRLAEAVLLFHATPWLSHCWGINSVTLKTSLGYPFHCDLDTLELNTEINCCEHTYEQTRSRRDHTIYGVWNRTLLSLAIVLIELEYWKPLDDFQQAAMYGDLVTIRRLAYGPSPFGPRYQAIVQKCLLCDFGHGLDFSSNQVRQAYYEEVVLPLQDMISSLFEEAQTALPQTKIDIGIIGRYNRGKKALEIEELKRRILGRRRKGAGGKASFLTDLKDSRYGWTTLLRAAEDGYTTTLRQTLDAGGIDVGLNGKSYGQRLRWLSTEMGQKAIVKFCLETGQVEVDSKDKSGRIPLSWATKNRHETIDKLMCLQPRALGCTLKQKPWMQPFVDSLRNPDKVDASTFGKELQVEENARALIPKAVRAHEMTKRSEQDGPTKGLQDFAQERSDPRCEENGGFQARIGERADDLQG
ncbi:MAG: hypothetical protein M1822_008527 [Bathelium mastoideum]|nr:MAG: hypothetical protein M1822_008527 [Bathelium mastoideum]